MQLRLDWDELYHPTRLSVFRSALVDKQGLLRPQNINGYWSVIKNVMYSAGLVSCVYPLRFDAQYFCWVWCPLDASQSIPDSSEYSEARLVTRRELSASLRMDREIW